MLHFACDAQVVHRLKATDDHPYFQCVVHFLLFFGLDPMFNKYWLMLGMIPLAGCVTETRREAVTYTMPPVASAMSEAPTASDPMGLSSAIALVRQQPWCYRRSGMAK